MHTRRRSQRFAFVTVAPALFMGVAPAAMGQNAMFRGDPAHRGHYASPEIRERPAARWTFATEGPVRSSPVVTGRLVVVGSDDGGLYAVDRSTGVLVWRLSTGGGVSSSPAVAGASAYVASEDGHVYAVDLASGAERWRAALGDALPFAYGYDYFISSPIVVDGAIIVGSRDGHLYQLDAETGDVGWRVRTGGRVVSSPAYADGTVFVGSMDGKLYAIDAASGAARWTFDTDGVTIDLEAAGYDRRSILSSPAVAAGVVIVGSRDAKQYAVDAESGQLRWKVAHPVPWLPDAPEVSWVEGSAAIRDSVVYVGVSDGRFVDAKHLRTGEVLWRTELPDRANTSPSVAGGVIVQGSGDGNLYGLDAETGDILWSFATGDAVHSSPAIADGVVYVGSDDGTLYAISDVDATGLPVPKTAVYYDANPRANWFAGAAALRDALAEAGYEVLDVDGLAGYLRTRIAAGGRSVVVFASDVVPSDIIDAEEGGTSLLRRYLDAGGRVVWVGLVPLLGSIDIVTGEQIRPAEDALRRILGVGTTNIGAADAEERRSEATRAGREWGLPSWGVYSFPVDPRDVTTVLARSPDGRATAWVKSFGSEGAGAFVRFWGRQRPLPDVNVVRALAEYGWHADALID